jgi:hypothetical protein
MAAVAVIGFVSEAMRDVHFVAARHERDDAGNVPTLDVAGHDSADPLQPRAIKGVFGHELSVRGSVASYSRPNGRVANAV